MKMTPPLTCAALSAALLAAAPALAQPSGPMMGASCSEAGMKTANESMMKMTDATKRTAAMKEMNTAMGMMAGTGMTMDMQMMAPNPDDSASTKGYKSAMMKTMQGMPMMKFTGDADFDFMNHMRSHHQGAVDMAKVVLANGKDAKVRKLAKGVVKAQEKEIAAIDAWLKANGKSASR